MDIFMEYIVKHKKSGMDYLKITGIIFLALILSLAALLFGGQIPVFSSFVLLVVAGIIYGAVFLIRGTMTEFEYILTNSDLDIDKIMAKSRRKRLVSVNFKEIEMCAPVNNRDCYNEHKELSKTYDCTGDGMGDIYFIDYQGEGGKIRVLFQPPHNLIEAVKKINPRCVVLAD